jgi:GNAT superfamily N-acetyltransferase
MKNDSTNAIVCRAATPDDASDIARVHDESRRAAYNSIVSKSNLNQMSLDERASFWRGQIVVAGQSDLRVFVAEMENSIQGFVAVVNDRKNNMAEIDRIYVSPAHMRKGIGRALIACALSYVRDYGFDKAILWTFEQNNSAQSFYVSMGFLTDGAQRKLPGTPKEIRFARAIEAW